MARLLGLTLILLGIACGSLALAAVFTCMATGNIAPLFLAPIIGIIGWIFLAIGLFLCIMMGVEEIENGCN